MTNVLFICHGNICRSPMAEFVLKHMVAEQGQSDAFHIESAATSHEEIGNDIHPGTKQKLREQHIPFTKRSARQMTKADYKAFDYILTMDSYNLRNVKRIIGDDPQGKVIPLLSFAGVARDIADPWYTGNFDETYQDVVTGCKAFLQQLQQEPTQN